jgi:hypothetical protein
LEIGSEAISEMGRGGERRWEEGAWKGGVGGYDEGELKERGQVSVSGNREQGIGNSVNREQGTGTGNREQGTGNREQGTGNREQGTGNREPGCGMVDSDTSKLTTDHD